MAEQSGPAGGGGSPVHDAADFQKLLEHPGGGPGAQPEAINPTAQGAGQPGGQWPGTDQPGAMQPGAAQPNAIHQVNGASTPGDRILANMHSQPTHVAAGNHIGALNSVGSSTSAGTSPMDLVNVQMGIVHTKVNTSLATKAVNKTSQTVESFRKAK